MVHSTENGAHAAANPKLGVILTKFVREIKYQSPPHDDTRPALEAAMVEYAAGSGVPYESEYAQLCFEVGLNTACTCYPSHPFAAKLHIAIYTWLITYIEDDEDGTEDLAGFQARFQKGEPQPSSPPARFAEALQAMSTYFQPLAVNFIVLSSLQFVNATLLERCGEFHGLQHCREASGWPDYVRDRTGVSEAYAYFIFPRDQCSDIGAYIQGIPGMMTCINYVNDVLSFHKETLAGETDNYINTRAACEQRDPLAVLETVVTETIAATSHVVGLLSTRSDPVYASKWKEFLNGYIFFHITTRRYKLHVYARLAYEGVCGREEFGGQRTSEQPVVGLL
ncbi:isoprenoid synthase domain-containing protein [Nemania sp. FL0031]|nr:isoprenoid synthase domain-containing protein [Nemania sp. FL0031]